MYKRFGGGRGHNPGGRNYFPRKDPLPDRNDPKEIIMNEPKGAFKKGEYETALASVDKILKKNPNDIFAISFKIKILGSMGRVEEARKIFDEAVREGIVDVVTYNSMIDAYGKKGLVEEAREIFNKAVEKRIVDVVTYTSMMDIYYKSKFYDEIEKLLQAAPENIRNSPLIFLMKQDAMRKQGKRDDVIKNIEQFLKENYRTQNYGDDVYVLAKVILAYSLKDSRRGDEAVEIFEELKRNTPISNKSYIRILCGYVFAKNGDIEEEEKNRIVKLLTIALIEGNGNEADIQNALDILNKRVNNSS